MSKHSDYEKKTEEIVLPVLQEKGMSLYDIEYISEQGQFYLRVYIDKEGGVSVDDCADVSRLVTDKLDEAGIGGDDPYIFEVSSPGLGRVLKKDKHLESAIGEDVDLKTYKSVNGAKEFTGTLTAFDKDSIIITFDDGVEKFSRKDIAQIRLSIDF